MIVYVKDKEAKQYRQAIGAEAPSQTPRNGWRKGQKYKTVTNHLYIIDKIDVVKGNRTNVGELKIYASRIK